jgi:hypothetical protein
MEGDRYMPSMNWSKLNHIQLGRYAEYYAKMEFASYGLDIYTSEVDDHGIDFVAKTKDGSFLELQVKAIRQNNYVFMKKDKWDIDDENTFLILLIFEDNNMPRVYMIPSNAWKTPNGLLCDNDYEGLKSEPEYGINVSKKNMPLLMYYEVEKSIESIL